MYSALIESTIIWVSHSYLLADVLECSSRPWFYDPSSAVFFYLTILFEYCGHFWVPRARWVCTRFWSPLLLGQKCPARSPCQESGLGSKWFLKHPTGVSDGNGFSRGPEHFCWRHWTVPHPQGSLHRVLHLCHRNQNDCLQWVTAAEISKTHSEASVCFWRIRWE